MSITNPKIFISYSWMVQDTVLELAKRLMSNGIDAVIDVWDLKEGQDKYAFMEQAVNDESIDKVLIICDKTYTEKANKREGGVGDETVIISQEVYGQVEQEKFIPIIFERDEEGIEYRPTFVKSRIYIDLSNDDVYEDGYEKLLRNLYNKPVYRKPALGGAPEWLEEEKVDYSVLRGIKKQIGNCKEGETSKLNILIKKFTSEFCHALKEVKATEKKDDENAIISIIDAEVVLRNLYVDLLDVLSMKTVTLGEVLPLFFETVFNTCYDAEGKKSYSEHDFDFYNFVIWEMFICSSAVLLHYENYTDFYTILNHSYFLRKSYFDESIKNYSYKHLQKYCNQIESLSKNRLYSYASEILTKREYKPLITKTSLCNADLVLYQLSQVFLSAYDHWFPRTYAYADNYFFEENNQRIWYKLKSINHCNKLLPLFGVNSIEKIKFLIKKTEQFKPVQYSQSFDSAPRIIDSIKIEEIGTIN